MKMLLNEFIVFKATTYYIRADLVLWNRCNKFLVGHYFIINNNYFFLGGDDPPYRKSRFASSQAPNEPVLKENS